MALVGPAPARARIHRAWSLFLLDHGREVPTGAGRTCRRELQHPPRHLRLRSARLGAAPLGPRRRGPRRRWRAPSRSARGTPCCYFHAGMIDRALGDTDVRAHPARDRARDQSLVAPVAALRKRARCWTPLPPLGARHHVRAARLRPPGLPPYHGSGGAGPHSVPARARRDLPRAATGGIRCGWSPPSPSATRSRWRSRSPARSACRRALIEFLIPVTIVVTGLENILVRRRERAPLGGRYRPVFAGVFGLVHGAGSRTTSRASSPARSRCRCFGFNVGIELGQLVVLGLAALGLAALDRALALAPLARGDPVGAPPARGRGLRCRRPGRGANGGQPGAPGSMAHPGFAALVALALAGRRGHPMHTAVTEIDAARMRAATDRVRSEVFADDFGSRRVRGRPIRRRPIRRWRAISAARSRWSTAPDARSAWRGSVREPSGDVILLRLRGEVTGRARGRTGDEPRAVRALRGPGQCGSRRLRRAHHDPALHPGRVVQGAAVSAACLWSFHAGV